MGLGSQRCDEFTLLKNKKKSFFSASSFHLPENSEKPILLIGPGTGIAPFRSFWQHWSYLKEENPDVVVSFIGFFKIIFCFLKITIFLQLPKVWLFFGCRTKSVDLYSEEKQEMIEAGVLDKVFLALSRERDIPKVLMPNLFKIKNIKKLFFSRPMFKIL